MFDVQMYRDQFPALRRDLRGEPTVFFDGPGGTQVPQRVIDAMVQYLSTCNANHGGAFSTSRKSDRVLHSAHVAMADFLNAPSSDEIVFGNNMTTLTMHLSRALARTWKRGDEVMVTRLDHDANVTPWVLAAGDAGVDVRLVDIHPEDCTLDLVDVRRQLSPRTKLVALACASNAVGTINDVKSLGRMAHEAGALVFLDAVHYAPHGPIDVQEWDCDFLACSTYKFFGPHVGVLWGKQRLLESLPVYKVRPAADSLPDRWMTGTQNHEGLAGVAAVIDYLESIGARYPMDENSFPALTGRRRVLRAGMIAIQTYEARLTLLLLGKLQQRNDVKVWGIADRNALDRRVPTVSLTMANREAKQIAEHLAARNINVWSGNMYALGLTERLGLENRGGLLRIGLVHYNTAEEIERLIRALEEI
jgi:cysteine desulfurase family protein (TIGR01976 family)